MMCLNNSLSNDSESNYSQPDTFTITYSQISIASIWIVLFFLSIIGNGLVIFLAIKFKKLNNMTNFYILNLAITDLLFVLFCIPFTTYVYLGGDWIFGQIPCKLSHFFSSASVQATCLTLTLMTIHRCNLIIKNKTYKQRLTTLKRRKIILAINTAFIWLVSFGINTPYLVFTVAVKEDTFTYCRLNEKTYTKIKFTNLINVVFAYTLPLLVIILSYTRLLLYLKATQKDKFKANTESGNLRRPKAEIKTLITKSVGKSKTKKVTQMVAIVTLNFGICWFPTHLFALLRHLHPDLIHASNSMYIFKIFANTLTYLTPVVNPCLYGFYNENFRTPLFQFISFQKKSNQKNNKL